MRVDGCWEARVALGFRPLDSLINEYPDFVHSLTEHAGCMDDLLVG